MTIESSVNLNVSICRLLAWKPSFIHHQRPCGVAYQRIKSDGDFINSDHYPRPDTTQPPTPIGLIKLQDYSFSSSIPTLTDSTPPISISRGYRYQILLQKEKKCHVACSHRGRNSRVPVWDDHRIGRMRPHAAARSAILPLHPTMTSRKGLPLLPTPQLHTGGTPKRSPCEPTS